MLTGPRQHDHAPAAAGLARRCRRRPSASSRRSKASATGWCRSTPPRWRRAQDRDRPRAAARAGGGRVRRRQRDADLDRHLGRRGAGWLRDMGPATRDLLHWVSALIALPAIAYAGRAVLHARPSAALRRARTNMDVPISIGVILVSRHQPGADHRRRRAHLFQFRHHAAVLSADRPRAGPSRARRRRGPPRSNC